MKQEQIGGYPVHPAAQLFPLMEEPELADLAERIKRDGFDRKHPLVLLKGQLLDGRNRVLACIRIKMSPAIREATPAEAGDPIGFVMRENLHRRHLTPSQRAAVAAEAHLLGETEAARERRRAGLKRGAGPVSAQGREREGAALQRTSPGKAAEKVAAISGASTRSVERAKAVKAKAPDLLERVKGGELTLRQAEKQIRRAAQLEQVKAYVPPAGEFPVIAADPPWKYDDQLDGSDAARGGCPYPLMTVEEICGLKVPAAPDCILWLWVTNTVLLEGWHRRVLDAWGFTGKTIWTWDKQDIITGRWGRNVTEHVIIAVRGKPIGQFESERTLFSEQRSRTHSQKPDEFFKIVERTCPATPRLEMFSRKPREGWVTSGAELPNPASRQHKWYVWRRGPEPHWRCRLCEAQHRGLKKDLPGGECSKDAAAIHNLHTNAPVDLPCLCTCAKARHRDYDTLEGREGTCRDCTCEMYEPAVNASGATAEAVPTGPVPFDEFRAAAKAAGFSVKLSSAEGVEYFSAQCGACDAALRVHKLVDGVAPGDVELLQEHQRSHGGEHAKPILWWLISAGPHANAYDVHAYPGIDVPGYTGPEVSTATTALCGTPRPAAERAAARGDKRCIVCEEMARPAKRPQNSDEIARLLLGESVAARTAKLRRAGNKAVAIKGELKPEGRAMCDGCGQERDDVEFLRVEIRSGKHKALTAGSSWGWHLCTGCQSPAGVARAEEKQRIPVEGDERRASPPPRAGAPGAGARSVGARAPARVREVKLKRGCLLRRGGGACASTRTPKDSERCSRASAGVVKATSGRLFAVCEKHAQEVMETRTLRVALD